ncbi:MAG: DUF2703 domain-containing protein [Eggerthellaceae bacterium]|nr:DUF2703 domain-containing protein [Eggerthellaceae bacterium]
MSEENTCCCGSAAESEQETCCCGGETPSSETCCSDSSYSCSDDPYNGRKKTAIVDFLYLDLDTCDRCTGADERVFKAVEACKPILAACGYNLILNQVLVEDESLASRFDFYSSPTIRVNGIDICPSVEENDCGCCSDISGTSVTCRLFPFNGTYYEVPPTDMIVSAIMKTVLSEAKVPAAGEYVLPENLKQFFEGKRAKEASGSQAKSKCCC